MANDLKNPLGGVGAFNMIDIDQTTWSDESIVKLSGIVRKQAEQEQWGR